MDSLITILIATHKKYEMPTYNSYLPVHVGKIGNASIGYQGDDVGDNISNKNPYYCELTALYWAWKNVKTDYIGLVHYRRYFSNKKPKKADKRIDCVLNDKEILNLIKNNDVILPKKRKYYVDTLYNHYKNTLHIQPLDITREIIEREFPEYLKSFDKVMRQTSGHMFNMFIMKKELSDSYCTWLFSILGKLEDEIDMEVYDNFHRRFPGRISELLLNVWIDYNQIIYVEVPVISIEKVNWLKKGFSFVIAKMFKIKYGKSS